MDSSSTAEVSASKARGSISRSPSAPSAARCTGAADPHEAWRVELAERLHAYRARRRKIAPNLGQGNLPFEEPEAEPQIAASVAVEEIAPVAGASPPDDNDFSFTIAIGRNAATREDSRMVIDVSQPPATAVAPELAPAADDRAGQPGLYPVASFEERRFAGLIDAACLMFAYGGFLTLFGSLGGQFTFSKLSAAVCVATFVIVYLQYFALFTVFGGTTPGMMLRGLHVVSFDGDTPKPRQMLWRSAGYMLSAGTLFMGFFWAMWDEDELTWHDRISHTYLAPVPVIGDVEATHVAHSR